MKNYKAYVGPLKDYDLSGALQFNLLTNLGLRDHHRLLDLGCGSLRAGKLLIPYLKKGCYYGLEPNKWLLDEGIDNELGKSILELKSPFFNYNMDFNLKVFNAQFDYIIAQSIFSHTGLNSIKKVFGQLNDVLKEEGLFLATFLLGFSDYKKQDWVYPECVRYKERTIRQVVASNGLKCVTLNWFHPSNQVWFIVFKPQHKKRVKELKKKLHVINRQSNTGLRYNYLFNLIKGRIYRFYINNK